MEHSDRPQEEEKKERGPAEAAPQDDVLNWQPIYKSAIWTL